MHESRCLAASWMLLPSIHLATITIACLHFEHRVAPMCAHSWVLVCLALSDSNDYAIVKIIAVIARRISEHT